MSEELVTVHFAGITHIDMTYGLAVQQMQKHIDKTDAEIARLNALLAEAREGLKFYAKREFFAVMPDDGKTRVVPINNEDGTFAYWLAFVNDDGGQARAVLTKLGA